MLSREIPASTKALPPARRFKRQEDFGSGNAITPSLWALNNSIDAGDQINVTLVSPGFQFDSDDAFVVVVAFQASEVPEPGQPGLAGPGVGRLGNPLAPVRGKFASCVWSGYG